ncbi:RagB/SusD family nutrient uptake outer membrane protein [Viscerimonas tarda]
MKNKIVYLAILFGSLLATSCDDYLDTKTLSEDNREYLCSNPTDAQKMVNHIYTFFTEDSYTSRMSNNWMQNTDVEFSPITKAQAEAHNDRRGVWGINAGDFGDIQTAYNHCYQAIGFANSVIEGIEASQMYKDGDKTMRQLLGETYCLRAYRYFLLCNFWGDVPFVTVPSVYGADINPPRSDKNIIYSQLIQDLVNVEESMLWADQLNNKTEVMNREFALGFIAKLALFRAGYSMQFDGSMSRCRIDDKIEAVVYKDENGVEQTAQTSDDFYKVAQAYCRKLIALKDRALPTNFKNIFYTQINSASPANSDVLFEMGFVQGGGGDVGWCIGIPVLSSVKGSTTNYTSLTASYVTSFDKEDQRFNVTVAPYKYVTESVQNAMNPMDISTAKWSRLDLTSAASGDSKNTGINWPILRYPDVLLMLAEADNEIANGPTAEAKDLLKRVRERAFVNASNKGALVDNYINNLNDYDSFKKAIRDERAWEFGGECVRKFDLIRWNYYSDAIVNTIGWMINAGMNAQKVKLVNGELIYDKNLVSADLNVANRLYFTFNSGMVQFENDVFTARDDTSEPYKSAVTISNDDAKAVGTSADLYRVDFAKYFVSVSKEDPTTKQPYGTDPVTGEDIQKGTIPESILYSWFGLTDGLVSGTENLSALRNKVTPYVMPLPKSRIIASAGVLSNEGYAIRNK